MDVGVRTTPSASMPSSTSAGESDRHGLSRGAQCGARGRVGPRTSPGLLALRTDEIFSDPTSPVGWNDDGDITIVEFFDYQCPYCKAVVPTLAQLKKEDEGIRYVYKEWPILGPVSEVAARAALAAEQQGRYEPFHEALMSLPGKFKEADIMKVAESVGLDVARLRRDMIAPEIQEALARTRALATALGITGTPAFIIGDNIVPGAVDINRLKALIKQAREQRGKEPT